VSEAAASAARPDPETWLPKPEGGRPLPAPVELEVRDGLIRLVGIPFFGIVVPNLTGLFAPVPAFSPAYFLGYAWFILLSGLLWQGNRAVLVAQRRHWDWSAHPWRKVALLLLANVAWTAPVTLAMLHGWYRFVGAPVDGVAVRIVTLANVICVVFITHVYETVHLIRQREDDQLRLARLEQARAEAELAALKAQVDPHFLFNSLNTLLHVIPTDPPRAVAFTESLAGIYRYILASRQRDLVPLDEELSFCSEYVTLLRHRFGEALSLEVRVPDPAAWLVPPISLQLLLENAVKHNAFDERRPLRIEVALDGDGARVENPVRPRSSARPTSGIGLRNLDERLQRIVGRPLVHGSRGDRFAVTVPLLRTGAA
jgi:sensor histidine kinase YesM